MMNERLKQADDFINTICDVLHDRVLFDLSLISRVDEEGQKECLRHRAGLDGGEVLPAIHDWIRECDQSASVVVRPVPRFADLSKFLETPRHLIQLDDLSKNNLVKISLASFAVLETSPGNYQAWLCVPGEQTSVIRNSLCVWLGADRGANGATRIPGSRNVKATHLGRFGEYPVVKLLKHKAREVSADQLYELGLPHEADQRSSGRPQPQAAFPAGRAWPSYQMCLDGAPQARTHKGKDRSAADFTWARTALQWGWSEGEVVDQLVKLSQKADKRKGGRDYAAMTVQKARDSIG